MKRLIAVALILVGLIAVAIAAAPFIAATDFAKRRIAAQIEDWTGHPVSFAGRPRVKLFPFLSLTIEDARIGGVSEAAGEPFVAMESLTCKLRLLPFLIGRIEVAEFQLLRPHFRLAIDADGGASWLMRRDKVAADTQTGASRPPRQADSSQQFGETRLGRFNIVDGSVTYADERNGRREEFSAVKVNLVWPRAKDAVSGAGAFSWRGETVEFNVSVRQPLDLIAGGASPARFAVASRPLRISFTGAMDTTGAARMEGPATVTTPSVRRLVQWLGTNMGEGPILGAGLIEGPLTWEGQKASFADAHFELDGNSGAGSLSVDLAERRPKVAGILAFQRLDLTAYLEAFQATVDAGGSWRQAPMDVPLLDIADAGIEVTADQVLLGTARFGRSAASVSVDVDGLAVHLGETRLYGGRVSADASLAVAGDGLTGRVRMEIEKARAAPVLREFGGLRLAEGTLSGTAEISATGETLEEIAASSAGTATFEIVNGALAGFELGELATLSGATGVADPAAGSDRIPFRSFGGSLALSDETLTSDDLRVEGDAFDLTLGGRMAIANAVVRARGTLTIGAGEGGPDERRKVPFVVGGSWDRPILLPDYERLIQQSTESRGIAPAGEPAEIAPPNG